ncbi:MAG: DUF2336 domain-containing protein [Alphaproteobacteria bacterium]
MGGLLARLLRALGLRGWRFGLGDERVLVRHKDVKVRARLAARTDVPPHTLESLARDPEPEVRRKIAANSNTPRHTDFLLAHDEDTRVRFDLAQKIGQLAPGLTAGEQDEVRRLTYRVLEILARDQITKVRKVLAETLKDVADAPPEIVKELARDVEIAVAGPLLRYSPVLTDEDLLEIIKSCTVRGPLIAISGRAGVAARVSDAIVAADDIEAVTSLLANPSAQIREETLDRIIDRAPDVEAWHEPLVGRPQLSGRAVAGITRFVADSLLEALEKRRGLDAETLQSVKTEMRRRLREGPVTSAQQKEEPAMVRAHRLKTQGRLGEKAMARALAAGDRAFVRAALAILTNEPLALVNKVLESKSAKGVTALCWKAEVGMRFAVQLQLRLARVAPSAVLNPRDGDQYPLTPEEMDWQIEFFRSMVPAGTSGPADPAKARNTG